MHATDGSVRRQSRDTVIHVRRADILPRGYKSHHTAVLPSFTRFTRNRPIALPAVAAGADVLAEHIGQRPSGPILRLPFTLVITFIALRVFDPEI